METEEELFLRYEIRKILCSNSNDKPCCVQHHEEDEILALIKKAIAFHKGMDKVKRMERKQMQRSMRWTKLFE